MCDGHVISSPEELHAIAAEWHDLCVSLPRTTPFQLPVWLLTWWAHFGSGELRVFCFRSKNQLVGLVPCFLHDWNSRRQLTLMGSGLGDYLEPAIHPAYAADVVACLARQLERCDDWDVCDWQDLYEGSDLGGLGSAGGFAYELAADTVCSRIRFPASFDEFWRARPKQLRRNMRRYTERALQAGMIEFQVADHAEPGLLEGLFRLHALRWGCRGESGMIAANQAEGFLRELAPRLAKEGLLRLFVLKYQSRLAAILLTMPFRQTIYSYLSAFDPEWEILGLGRTLLHDAVKHSFEHGFTGWDFLRGDEPYKLSWGAMPIPKIRLRIQRAQVSSSAGRAATAHKA